MFNWDKGNINHIAQHGISPAEAEQVINNNPLDLDFDTRNGEERTAQLGPTDAGRILVVITTMRDDLIRVVTAYPATKRLQHVYLTQKDVTREGGIEETELQE